MAWVVGIGLGLVLLALGWIAWSLAQSEREDARLSQAWYAQQARRDGVTGWEHGRTDDDPRP